MPPGGFTLKVNLSEFTPVLRRYASLTSRTPAEIVNKKGYYVSRRAIWYTPKVEPDRIRAELGESKAHRLVKTKRGRWSRSKKHLESVFGTGASTSDSGVPFLALIIQARAKKGGHASPFKGKTRAAGAAAMLAKMRQVFGGRMSSIAFIKAGFIAARELFKPFAGGSKAGLPPEEKGRAAPRQIGPSPKGGGTVAREGWWKASATLWNSADARHDKKASLFRVAEPALQKAIDIETLDTQVEVEKRLREHAKACGIRTHG